MNGFSNKSIKNSNSTLELKQRMLEKIRDNNKKDKVNKMLATARKNLGLLESIQRVLSPADADAFEQHEEAQKQAAERRNPDKYDKLVKELVEDTASDKSRYRHFDVVDRKDLAKQINEAKERGLKFKISRSLKEGFRYSFDVLEEDVDRPRPRISGETLAYDLVEWLSNHEGDVLRDAINWLKDERGYSEEQIDGLFYTGDALIENKDCDEKKQPLEEAKDDEDDVEDEVEETEIQVKSTPLDDFKPDAEAKETWDLIVKNGKVEDLNYALETLYPNGISDAALNDLLAKEKDWVLDVAGFEMDDNGDYKVAEVKTPDVDEDEIEDFDMETEVEDDFDFEDDGLLSDDDEDLEDDEVVDTDVVDFEDNDDYDYDGLTNEYDEDEVIDDIDDDEEFDVDHAEEWTEKHPHGYYKSEKDYGTDPDDDDDIEVVDIDESLENANLVAAQPKEGTKIVEEPKEEEKKEEQKEALEVVEDEDESNDELAEAIGKAYVENVYKPQSEFDPNKTVKEKQQDLAESALKATDEEDEVVGVDDDLINEAMGFQKEVK